MATQDQQGNWVGSTLLMGGWMLTDFGKDRLTKFNRGLKIQTGMNPKTMMGQSKSWATWQGEMAARETNIASLEAKKIFRNKATQLYGGSKLAGALTKGLGIANMLVLAPMLFGMTYHGFKGIQKLGMQLERPELGGHLTLNSLAFTDRQRSIQAMHNSEFNGRSAMGQEAGLLHR